LETAPQIRVNLFKQIHEIIFHGKGGYDYNTVYSMPIWLRKFTFREIQKWYTEEKEAIDNQQNSGKTSLVDSSGKVNAPAFRQASKQYERKSSYK
jgi:hypothetical protein